MVDLRKDLLDALYHSPSDDILKKIEQTCMQWGFEYYAYGLRVPLPLTHPKTVLKNNYPLAWQERYQCMNYLAIDPSITACQQSISLVIWTDALFSSARSMWEEAQAHDLHVGWAQAVVDRAGFASMLTFARPRGTITPKEIAAREHEFHWLAYIAHQVMSRSLSESMHSECVKLTGREVEILRWTADGKTSSDIALILSISENTVNFHIKNAISKLSTPNKTAAVVQAALLGYLN